MTFDKKHYLLTIYVIWILTKWSIFGIVICIPKQITTGPEFQNLGWLLSLSSAHIIVTALFIISSLVFHKAKGIVCYAGIAFALLYTYLFWHLTF